MPENVIKIENISKQYRLGVVNAGTLVHDLNRWWAKLRGKKDPALKIGDENKIDTVASEYVWALKDINLEVKQGEVLGIIGKNGAGKSTLLKILSKVTAPTAGTIKVKGKIASLLEVGTGFNPELTGRENIFLNGAILGMTRQEINNKFDDIVDFSGVEKYIDTPVKRYSSGMYVRLAFAVAAHLEPEILIIDEVLAVGDAEFQKKAIGKMNAISKTEGRTVLFVSHNMAAVNRLCQNVILLKDGIIQHEGSADEVINLYLQSDFGTTARRRWDDESKAPGDDIVRLIEVRAHTKNGNVSDSFDITKQIGITMDYEVLKQGHTFTHGCSLYNSQGVNILNSHDVVSDIRRAPRNRGTYSTTIWIPGNYLAEGMILVGVSILKQDPFFLHFHEPDVVAFNVTDKIRGDSARGDYVGGFPGIVRPILKWETKQS